MWSRWNYSWITYNSLKWILFRFMPMIDNIWISDTVCIWPSQCRYLSFDSATHPKYWTIFLLVCFWIGSAQCYWSMEWTVCKAQFRCYGFMVTPLQLSDLRTSRNGGIKFFYSLNWMKQLQTVQIIFVITIKVAVYLASWPFSELKGYSNTIFTFFKL